MFIGRDKELKKLNSMYLSDKLEVAVIYGRRRVGKTTLINEFCKGKKTIFFASLESSAEQNLSALSSAILFSRGSTSANASFKSFSDAFDCMAEMARDERVILVIDEFPYLAKSEPSISSLLQNYIDRIFKNTRLFIILCGSSMSFMENQVLGYQSPLYGRRTAQFKILPFDYLDTGKWFPDYSPEQKAIMYGITGGIPLYLEQFSPQRSIKDNLLDAMFDKNAFLFEEPSNLLKQELREPATYNAIITAIASGKTKLSEITSTMGLENSLCLKYISNLITLGILKRETPITDRNSKRPVYMIEDQFFRFWYTFVPKNMAAIQSERIGDMYETAIESKISDYMGLCFERMCRDYVLYHDEALPINIGEIGQWWGGDPKTKKQAKIDIVVTSSDSNRGIVGSCKFKNERMPESELLLLKEYAQICGAFEDRYYYLFSKSGFSDALIRASDKNVRLITLSEMYD